MKFTRIISIFGGFLMWNSAVSQSVFDCQPQLSVVTQNQIYVPNPFFYQRCITFDQNTNYVYDQTSQYPYADIHLRAGKSITIEPGFRAGQFANIPNQGTGSFLADIDPEPVSPFDVAVMNYPNTENILKNARFELGVELPATIQNAINNFLLDQAGAKINPYLSWEIEVTADFYRVANPSDIHTIHGFHYVPYESEELPLPPVGTPTGGPTGAGFLDLLGGWTEQPNDYPFRIRFAPPATGDWVGQIHIKTPGQIISSTPFPFRVIPSTIQPPVTVGANKRYLERGGQSFMPLGNNLKWPRTTCPIDQELAAVMGYNGGSAPSWNNIEQYKAYTPPVRTYRKFREQIDALADGGANTFRMLMAPQSNEIEFEELGNYYRRQHIAYEMDQIVYKAEERDMLIDWNMQVHFPYTTGIFWIHYWDWAKDPNDPNEFGNCYQSLPNVDKPIDFFEQAEARKYYKERLRYILARWGYSNNILAFELFSEIDQIGAEYAYNPVSQELEIVYCEYSASGENNGASGCSPNDPKYQINQQTIQDWQTDMINYMHNILGHDKHLYQVSYAGKPGDFDHSYVIPDVDFIDRNVYDATIYHNENNTVSFDFPRLQVKSMSINSGQTNYFDFYGRKPAWYSETGPSSVESKGCDKQIEMVRNQWKMLFSGVSGALDWESDIHQFNNYGVFGKMNTFLTGVNLDQDKWHPGNTSLVLNTSTWNYSSGWNTDMVRNDKRGDLMYLRKGNADEAIGMITNTTYNYYNHGQQPTISCFENEPCSFSWASTPIADANMNQQLISSQDKKGMLRLRGMDATKYRIDYYWSHNPTSIIHTSYGWGPMIQLEYDMEGNNNEYIMLFKASRVWEKSVDRVVEEEREEVQLIHQNLFVYPNPSDGEFRVELNEEVFSENLSVTVTDMLGRIVYKEENIPSNTFDVRITGKDPGVYVVIVMRDEQKWVNKVILE